MMMGEGGHYPSGSGSESEGERDMYMEEEEEETHSRGGLQIHVEKPDRVSGKKRKRTSFTHKQLHELEKAFQQNHIPELRMREALAERLGLDEKTVRYWFQNRRQKLREQQKKEETGMFKAAMKSSGSDFGREMFAASGPTYGFPILPGGGGYPTQPPQRMAGYVGDQPSYYGPPQSLLPGGGPMASEISKSSEMSRRTSMPYPIARDEHRGGSQQIGGAHRTPHQCCPCIHGMQRTFEQLARIVPGAKADMTNSDILHATLTYVRNVQSYVNTGIYPSPHIASTGLQPPGSLAPHSQSSMSVPKTPSSQHGGDREEHQQSQSRSAAKWQAHEGSQQGESPMMSSQQLPHMGGPYGMPEPRMGGGGGGGGGGWGDHQKLQPTRSPMAQGKPISSPRQQPPPMDE